MVMQDWTDTGNLGYRKGGFRTGGMWKRKDAKQEGYRTGSWDAGQVGCRTGEMQEWRDAGLEGCRTGGIQDWRDEPEPDCFTLPPATGPNRFPRFPRAVTLQLHYAVHI